MTPDQYRDACERLGLNQEAAAAFLGVSIRTESSYRTGESPIRLDTAKLLRLMVRLKIKPEDVK